ncbi:MAG: hypothetical protein ABIQ86_07055 [Steroidobacteraceae bacterium]
MTPTELWLPIGAAAFYLYDSSCLLWQNELIFTRGRKRWLVAGGTALRLAGRRLFLPNPLTPLRPQFQVRWSLVETRTGTGNHDQLLLALRPISVLNQLQLLLLLALPLLAWTLGAGLMVLVLFILFYLLTLAALILVWQRRSSCGLDSRAFWLLALDALACAPFAVNLTRKISTRHGIAGDPLVFAARHLDAAARAATRLLIAARAQEAQAASGSGDAHSIELLLSRLET